METAYVNQKEAINLVLTIKDKSSLEVINVSTATVTLYCKTNLDDSIIYQFTINNANVDKTQGANGILRIPISSSNLNFYGTKYCILKLSFSENNIRKVIFKIDSTSSPE